MSKHTPEPWKISHDDSTEEWSIVTNQQGSIIANVNEETGPELVGSDPVMRKMPGLENASRIVACVNACAGMADPAAEIAELKRQRDELLGLVKAVSYHSIPATVDGIKCAAFPWVEYESMVIKAKGSSS